MRVKSVKREIPWRVWGRAVSSGDGSLMDRHASRTLGIKYLHYFLKFGHIEENIA